jgi:hypothetical protein
MKLKSKKIDTPEEKYSPFKKIKRGEKSSMLSFIEERSQNNSVLQEFVSEVQQAVSLKALILAAFKLGLAVAVAVVEEVLNQRGREQQTGERLVCPKCEAFLESKGIVPRSVKTLIGAVSWKRRVLRCPHGCEIGQIARLDRELGLQPNQRVSDELKQAACVLAVFVPFGIASLLLKSLFGIEVSSGAIWNWVQCAGKDTMTRLQHELSMLAEQLPDAEELATALAQLPLLLGGDGVMVPFRPETGSAKGKTVWREVKVGILVRLGQHVTRAGDTVSVFMRRRLVAVLGSIDEFRARMWLTAVKEGILQASTVVWLSDGGRGFWRLFNEQFSFYALGILDFYHASQNLWKGARAWLDGRTARARTWFASARHRLRAGRAQEVVEEMKAGSLTPALPASVRKTLENVIAYLEAHQYHIDYELYKELGLPIGSGMVESACKWLIQQRFKCVGMRWSEDGFNHLLHLRLAWVNGTFDDLFCSTPSPNS